VKYDSWLYDEAHNSYCGQRISTELKPGYYTLSCNGHNDPVVSAIKLKDDSIVSFLSGPYPKIIKEIEQFWDSDKSYEEMKITHKRGILLYGPPGCGKSALIVGIINKLMTRKGFAFNLSDTNSLHYFVDKLPLFRQIEKDVPILAIIEDIENICDEGYEEYLLEVLDGTESLGNNVIFICTTNKLDKIPDRIKHRPSRIDTLIEVGLPDNNTRKEFIKHLLPKSAQSKSEVIFDKTKGLSLAEIKEVIVASIVYKRDLNETVTKLNSLKTKPKKKKKKYVSN